MASTTVGARGQAPSAPGGPPVPKLPIASPANCQHDTLTPDEVDRTDHTAAISVGSCERRATADVPGKLYQYRLRRMQPDAGCSSGDLDYRGA